MKYAIVDLGSNTIRLSVYQLTEGGGFRLLFSEKEMAGLVNYIQGGVMLTDGIEKACRVIRNFQFLLGQFQIESLRVFATASLRNIQNVDEAVQTIRKRTGVEVEVLSGQEEATLGYFGALTSTTLSDGYLFDIGGGSTELVTVAGGHIEKAQSYPVGSLSLFKDYVSKIWPKKREIAAIQAAIDDTLQRAGIGGLRVGRVCGIGGTARAVLKIGNNYFQKPYGNRALSVAELHAITEMLTQRDLTARQLILKKCPDRIHTILPGCLLMDAISSSICRGEIYISPYGVREGYLCRRLIQNTI